MLIINRKLNYGRETVKSFLNKQCIPFSNVLDLGAGSGNDLMTVKEVNNKAILYGVDFYEPNIQILRNKGIKVFEIDIEKEKIPLPDSFIDVVMANQILEHLKEVFWAWHEVSRILRKGGKLIIGVPNLASLHNRLLLLFGKQPTCIKNFSAHVRGYTLNDIINFQEKCWGGYKLLKYGGSNFYPFPSIIANFLSKRFPTMATSIFLIFEKRKEYHGEFLTYLKNARPQTNFYQGK